MAPGLLQAIDPRVKLLTFLGWLLFTTWVHRFDILVGLYSFTLALAMFSRIPLTRFILRTWLFIPLFTGIMVLPTLCNFVTPGEPIWMLAQFAHPVRIGPWVLPDVIAVTRQGLMVASGLVMRVATAVSWVTLLTLTTPGDRLLHTLQVLRVPQTFLMVLGLMHRYLHRLVREAEELHLAMQSRIMCTPMVRTGQRLVATRVGVLLRKSLGLSQEVYQAMCARGYTGEVRLLHTPSVTGTDYAWLVGSFILLGAVMWLSQR